VTEERPQDGEAASAAEPEAERRATAARFFLVPLLVVLTAVAVFWVFSRLTFEQRTPADFLAEVRGGTANRRWQAAFELSRSLPRLDPTERAALASETLRIFKTLSPTRAEDVPVRRYLALVLGKLGERDAVDALIAAVKDPDPDTRLYAVWALGKIGDPRALPAVTEASFAEDAGMRKMAAYVLGRLGDRRAAERLRVLLGDPAADVRWNAAIALASLGDPAGLPVLRSIVDRDAQARQARLSSDQAEIAMIGALKALELLKDRESLPLIDRVASSDPNLRVRAAAREASEATRRSQP
jgi:HEAT repeats/PBS lyase HEAT-like repeat